jgi:hypothetical protein
MTLRRRAAAISALSAALVAAIGLGSCNTANPPSLPAPVSPPRLANVNITLLGRAVDIEGATVPPSSIDGDEPDSFQIEQPALINLAVPGGKHFSLPVKTAFVNTMKDVRSKTGVVMDVLLLPLQESVPFASAVAELHRLLLSLGITPGAKMRKYLDGLPSNSGTFIYRTGTELSADVKFMVEIRPDGKGGWFLVLTFGAVGDASRAVWDDRFSAKRKPAAKKNGEGADPVPNQR